MFKCSGICSTCGRCFDKDLSVDTAGPESAVFIFPDDFKPDSGEGYGVAFDIGTTTVAGTLWNLESGRQLAATSSWNPQAEFGSDVISRIVFCREEGNLDLLRNMIRECVNGLTADLCAKAGVPTESVLKAFACGNTTMSHIFAGYPPEGLAMAPFEPAYRGQTVMKAGELGLNIDAKADVTVMPGIAGHVGGDITAGINAARLDRPPEGDTKGLTVYVDIGTNGEIVLSDNGKLFACSTAAGPAFEGGAISCGMRAVSGAAYEFGIEDEKITFRTIGDAPIKGICGTGLIDAAAKMLDADMMDETGKLEDSVYLDDEKQVFISQKDIRELQLAKSAIRAGIKALLIRAGKGESDIGRIIIAGAFGSNTNIESAIRIGLLPQIDKERVFPAGNAAGAGAAMALTSERENKRAGCIAELVSHVELATEPEFQELFIGYINF